MCTCRCQTFDSRDGYSDGRRVAIVVPFGIVATKADKLKRNALNKQVKKLKEGFGAKGSEFKVFSSLNGKGQDPVWTKIEDACGCTLYGTQQPKKT